MKLKSFISDKSDLGAICICLGAFCIWYNLLLEKFLSFGYYDWDLAMYAQAVWALTQGQFYSSIFHTNFLTNHAEYIAFFLVPFYKLFPSAFTLIIFKILALTSGAYVFYLIGKRLIGAGAALIFLLLYLIHPANAFMMIYEFHFENLAIPFIFLMYYFYLTERLRPFIIAAFFAAIVKENISLVVFMFSFLCAFSNRKQKLPWIVAPAIIGGGLFVLSMFVITPYLRHLEGFTNSNPYVYLYWNSEPKQTFLGNLLPNVSHLWGNFNTPSNYFFLKSLFGPFTVLPFLSPGVLILGMPIMVQNFFSSALTMHTMFYHYGATLITFIFLSTIVTISKIFLTQKNLLKVAFIALTGVIFISQLSVFIPQFMDRVVVWDDRLDPIRTRMLNKVSTDDSIIASFDFLAPLASQKETYSLHNLWQNFFPFNNRVNYKLPSSVNTSIIDWQCPWLWGDLLISNYKTSQQYLTRIQNFYNSKNWGVVDSVEDLTLLSTKSSLQKLPALVEVSKTPFSGYEKFQINVRAENLFEFHALKIGTYNHSQKILPMEMIWYSRKNLNEFYKIIFLLKSANNIIQRWEHPIGYAFQATPLWEKGDYILERYNLLLPTLKPGQYSLYFSVINMHTGEYVDLERHSIKGIQINVLNLTIPKKLETP